MGLGVSLGPGSEVREQRELVWYEVRIKGAVCGQSEIRIFNETTYLFIYPHIVPEGLMAAFRNTGCRNHERERQSGYDPCLALRVLSTYSHDWVTISLDSLVLREAALPDPGLSVWTLEWPVSIHELTHAKCQHIVSPQ